MALRSLASRVRGSALDVRAAAPHARPMNYSSHLQGGHQGKGADLHPVSPTDLLPEAKWRNVKKDGIVMCGADIHTSAPRVLPPAPCTVPLLGGLPMFRRSSSLVVPSLGVPALPLACRLSRLAINAYGLTCFGSGQQQRGFSEKPFQSLDSKTAVAMYDQLSPEGRRVASLANMAGNEAVRNMECWNKLINQVSILGSTCVYVVAAVSAVVWYVYLSVKEGVVELSGKYGEMAASLLSRLVHAFFPSLGDKFVWKDESGKKAAEKSEAPTKK